MRSSHKWLVFLVTVLSMVWTQVAFAQSREQNPDRRTINATMDPVLEGDWAGRGNDLGMRTDPLAIACMVRKCAAIRAAFPNDKSQWRNSRNFAQCYMEHAERVKRQDYVPIANPPGVHLLGCGLIEAQRHSQDDRVYEAVNGRARPQPQPQMSPPSATASAHKGPPVSAEDIKALETFAASASALAPPPPPPVASASSAPPTDDNPYVDEPPARKPVASTKRPAPPPVAKAANDDNPYGTSPSAPAASGHGPGDLGDKLVLRYANETEAAIYVKPGGQFYTVRASWLAKTYESDWDAVYSDPEAKSAQFFGACFEAGGKVSLDQRRMKMRAYDVQFLVIHPNQEFKDDCKKRGGEFRFALQAGQTIRLKAKSNQAADKGQDDAAKGKDNAPASPPAAAVASADQPAPDATPPVEMADGAPPPVANQSDTTENTPATDMDAGIETFGPDATSSLERTEPSTVTDNPLGTAFGHDRTPRFAKFEMADGPGLTDAAPPPATALPATREGLFVDDQSATSAGEAPEVDGPGFRKSVNQARGSPP